MTSSNGDKDSPLRTPLLSNYSDDKRQSISNSIEDEVLTVDAESGTAPSRQNSQIVDREKPPLSSDVQADGRTDHSMLSKFAFQQIHDAYEPNTGDFVQDTDVPKLYVSKRSLRNPILKKSFVARAAYNAKTNPKNFLYNVLTGLVLWPKWSWTAMKANKNLTTLSLKQGLAAGVAAIFCVVSFPPPYDGISSIAIWAVVTTDLLYESNIGLSVSKGLNRILGTLAAVAIAIVLNQLGPVLGKSIYAFYVIFCVFIGGAVFRFLKGIPPLKDQWGYAFTVATIAFHLFIISGFSQPERWTFPLLRFLMILVAFFLSTLINLAFKPVYAGDTLHTLVAKNFETAASVLQRCVEEYNKDTKLDHVPDILSGRSEDDKIHQSYHEVVMSDSDIDKLLNAVHWEPCHGPFFMGYPWHLYDDITDYLRYTLYDVIALDSCLRANIQAPKHLRDLFAQEMATIADECAHVLTTLADSMKDRRKFEAGDMMRRAEEAAVALQYKIYVHTHLLLGRGAPQSPRYPVYMASLSPFSSHDYRDTFPDRSTTPPGGPNGFWQDFMSEETKLSGSGKEDIAGHMSGATQDSGCDPHSSDRPRQDFIINLNVGSPGGSPMVQENAYPLVDPCPMQGNDRSPSVSRSGRKKVGQNTMKTLHEASGAAPSLVVNSDGQLSRSSPGLDFPYRDQEEKRTPRGVGWKESFLQRRGSLGHNWEGTLERISALSLVKFASLLIEVVAKMKYVVESVDDLSEQARFKERNVECVWV